MSLTVTGRITLTGILTIPPRIWQDIGDLAVRRIRTRTEKGISVDGGRFQALSNDYRKAKRKAGLSPQPDLTVSGRMLNEMQPKITQHAVEIRFLSSGGRASGRTFIQRSRSVGSADKAYFHNEAGAGRSRVIRKFFGLNSEDESVIVAMIDKQLGVNLK